MNKPQYNIPRHEDYIAVFETDIATPNLSTPLVSLVNTNFQPQNSSVSHIHQMEFHSKSHNGSRMIAQSSWELLTDVVKST